MACGMTPELFQMIAQMQEEKKEHAQEELGKWEKELSKAKAKKDGSDQNISGYDWTNTYTKWDQWEDPEEIAKKEEEARRRYEHAQRRTACNHDHSAERKLMEMSMDDKLKESGDFNFLGNQFYAEGQYQRAAYYYHRGLVYFEYMFPEEDEKEQEQQMKLLQVKMLSNFAACRLKTKNYKEVIQKCSEALKIDPTNVKVLYRRAQAHRLRDDYDEAMEDINQAIELDGETDALRVERDTIRIKREAYRLSEKKTSQAMFKFATEATPKDNTSNEVPEFAFNPSLQIKATPEATADSFEWWKPNGCGRKELKDWIRNYRANEKKT